MFGIIIYKCLAHVRCTCIRCTVYTTHACLYVLRISHDIPLVWLRICRWRIYAFTRRTLATEFPSNQMLRKERTSVTSWIFRMQVLRVGILTADGVRCLNGIHVFGEFPELIDDVFSFSFSSFVIMASKMLMNKCEKIQNGISFGSDGRQNLIANSVHRKWEWWKPIAARAFTKCVNIESNVCRFEWTRGACNVSLRKCERNSNMYQWRGPPWAQMAWQRQNVCAVRCHHELFSRSFIQSIRFFAHEQSKHNWHC